MDLIVKDEGKLETISVVCPFYNEELIIEKASKKCIEAFEALNVTWELILVNDGSTDGSLDILKNCIGNHSRIKIVTYTNNQGRGYALKSGINIATGDIIITTELDLSWGENIVEKIYDKFKRDSSIDVVVASPHLKRGGYKNVPFKRVLLSQFGNILIRTLFVWNVTMNTGMTRGYKRKIIQSIKTLEKGKEFHLEVLLKLNSLGVKIIEIPAVLEWKDKQLRKKGNETRQSSTNLKKIIKSHLTFLFFAKPIKYFWAISVSLAICSLGVFIYGVFRFLTNQVSIYMALMSLLLAIFSLLFLGFGVISDMNLNILKEFWFKDAINKN